MKNLKFIILSILFALFTMSSCDEEALDMTDNNQSESARKAMSQLRTHYDNGGDLTINNNPTENIVFDFCFDFVYPVTLSYNNETTVIVETAEQLIEILIGMTDSLFINGIVFPFDVETYDEQANSFITQTINNEFQFAALLLSCNFDITECTISDDDIPVCVLVEETDGTFILSFPNMCFAEEFGFTQEDIVDCETGEMACEISNFTATLGECNDDGTYVVTFDFDIENPSSQEFTLFLEMDSPNNGTFLLSDLPLTLNLTPSTFSDLEWASVFFGNNCADTVEFAMPECNNTCEISNFTATTGNCNDDGTYAVTFDFDIENPPSQEFTLFIEMDYSSNGTFLLSDLPLTLNLTPSTFSDLEWASVFFGNDCTDIVEFSIPECSNITSCWDFVYPVDITL